MDTKTKAYKVKVDEINTVTNIKKPKGANAHHQMCPFTFHVTALCTSLFSSCGPGCSVVSVQVSQLWFSAPVKLSDSGRSGSRAGQGPESASTQPACLHAHGSASDMADPEGAGKLQYLPSLWEKVRKNKETHQNNSVKCACHMQYACQF